MTAPKDRPEIQRYEAHAIRMMNGVHYASLRRHDNGKSVLYSDHIHHLKLAQIAVLEKMAKEVCYGCRHEEPVVKIMGSTYHLTGHAAARESCNSWPITNHIAALKEELAK